MTSVVGHEALPAYSGHEKFRFIKAAVTMAQFVVLAEHDPAKTPEEIREIEGSFVYASMLACPEDKLAETMAIDLSIAGMSGENARRKAAQLNSPESLQEVYTCAFIRKHNPRMGLWKRPRMFKGGQFRAGITAVNEPKFLAAILKLKSF